MASAFWRRFTVRDLVTIIGLFIVYFIAGKLGLRLAFVHSNAIKNEIEGTGLGLFMVKAYVEGWGGRVWLESPTQGDRGTTFHLELPLALANKNNHSNKQT